MADPQNFDKLGSFYLGKTYDLEAGITKDPLVLYESKDLTTHGVCVGMTGSGKTGLCLALLEEAAIDGIPAIAIDPKGDLGNLLLAFPDLTPESFKPWVDPAEASRRGMTVDEFAAKTARQWKDGLAEWGEDGPRIQRFRDAVDIAIYTPGSTAGLPLSVLKSFDAPESAVLNDSEALRDRIGSSASGLLALMGIEADPLRSREHILLSNLLEAAWRNGHNSDLPTLIREIQKPPLKMVGTVPLDSFYPEKERFELAMQINNLLASPGFSAWMEGEPLNIERLLHTAQGKPRLSIISIAHLSDAERMFFVTLLLGEMIAWMRSQSGTSSLRALLYMDEVFGYFPPSANPPSKTPMLTLLKQARAYGLGVVLATQNPVDLDYKGLSNAGTWFLGRLQTERDKARVLDGLEGASTAAGAQFDRAKMERILSGLGNRVFLMNNVHSDQPVVFQTRWILSYLRGPLTREQISTLMSPRKQSLASSPGEPSSAKASAAGPGTGNQRPILPSGIPQVFLPTKVIPSGGHSLVYKSGVLGSARIHLIAESNKLDSRRNVCLIAECGGELPQAIWDEAAYRLEDEPSWSAEPSGNARYEELPAELTRPKDFAKLSSALRDHLYASELLKLWRCKSLDELSRPGESQATFRARLAEASRLAGEEEVRRAQADFAADNKRLLDRRRRAEQRLEKEKSQRGKRIMSFILRMLTFVPMLIVKGLLLVSQGKLKGMTGRGGLTSARELNKMGTAGREMGQVMGEQTDVRHAAQELEAVDRDLEARQQGHQTTLAEIASRHDVSRLVLEEEAFRPKKSDIQVNRVAIVWLPYDDDGMGKHEPAFELPAK